MQPFYYVPDLFFRDFVQADASWAVLSQQAPPHSRWCRAARANAACNLPRRPVATELLINLSDQIGAARAASWRSIFRFFRDRQSAVRVRQPDLDLPWRSSRETVL